MTTESTGATLGSGGTGSAGSTALDASRGAPLPAISDVIPEKYRDKGANGQFDLEASARKLATGYRELAGRMRQTGLLPASARDYTLKGLTLPGVDEVDVKALRANPGIAGMLEQMHAQGFSDAQATWAVSQAIQLLDGGRAATSEETETALREVWKTDQEYSRNITLAARAVQQLAPLIGVQATEVMTRYGNDPTLVKLFARLGHEMREDTPAQGLGPEAKDFATQVAEIDAQLNSLPAQAPQRQQLVEQKLALYTQRYPGRR